MNSPEHHAAPSEPLSRDWESRLRALSAEQRHRLRQAIAAELGEAPRPGTRPAQVVAYYTVAEGSPSSRSLREFLATRLPEFMIPHTFIGLDELPVTPNGKVDRAALPDPSTAPKQQRTQEYVEPRTSSERILAEVWRELLQVEKIGIRDNFFEYGGDSIRSVQMLNKARERGLSFTLQQTFKHRTIEALAQVAEQVDQNPIEVGIAPFSLISAADRTRLPRTVVDAYPVAALQAGMIFHGELEQVSAVYHDVTSGFIEGPLDSNLLKRAIYAVIQRHAVLRTSFALSGYSEPLQLVHEQVEPVIEFVDLSSLSVEDARQAVKRWFDTERQRPFDWRQPPLVRFAIHRLSATSFQFGMSNHHAIIDGWSGTVIVAEIFEGYTAALRGSSERSAEPPELHYSQFIALEQEAMASEVHRQFWLDHLATASFTALPRPDSTSKAENGRSTLKTMACSEEEVESLRQLAKAGDASLKSVLLAAHLKVIATLIGRRDVVTGVIANGRPETAGGEQVLGLFLNTLPIHQQLTGGTWVELVQAAASWELETMPHRRFPLAELQRLHGGRPLFDSVFNYVHFHAYERVDQLSELRVLDTVVAEQTNFLLNATFSVNVGGTPLLLTLNNPTGELPVERLEAIAGYYRRVFEQMAQPEARYDRAELLSTNERQLLLETWNDTQRLDFAPRQISAFFAAACRQHPRRTAVIHGDQAWTYAELEQRVHRISHRLRQLGVQRDTRVAVAMTRSADLVAAVLGILESGGAYVPLDPNYPAQRLATMLRRSGAHLLLTERLLLKKLPTHLPPTLLLGVEGETLDDPPDQAFEPASEIDNLALVIFTSGSTGVPKGVAITHRSVSLLLQWAAEEYTAEEVRGVLASTSISFDLSVFEIFVPLSRGGTVVLAENALALGDLPAADAVTLINTVPSAISELLDAGAIPNSVRTVNLAGEALPRSLVNRLGQRHPDLKIVNLYGPSEDTTYSIFTEVAAGQEGPPAIGRPIANTRVRLLGQRQELVPVGTAGELHLGGSGLARGYLDEPSLTAASFVPDPFASSAGDRLYRTGDLARYRTTGELEFLGRVDHQVKLRGFRIEPGEIEAKLEQHQDIDRAIVLCRDDLPWGTGLVAYLQPAGETLPKIDELHLWLRLTLPEIMLPAAVEAVDRFPLTASGKVDRAALPMPKALEAERARPLVAARNLREELLLGIFQHLLGTENISIHDSFFARGGHSLLAMQAVSRIREALSINLPLDLLFQNPTVAGLAAVIDERGPTGQDVSVPTIEGGEQEAEIPLSFAQERLWFLEQMAPGTPYYNIPFAVSIDGALDPRALEASLVEILRRHQVLRTVYPTREGKPWQRIEPTPERILSHLDLSRLSETGGELNRRAEEEARQPLDLEHGPVLRATLIRLAERRHALLITIHHIACDYWSAEILMRELATLYDCALRGEPSPLPELAIQYGDYSTWERRRLTGEVLETKLAYWQEQLASAPPVLELPTDRPRPETQSNRGRREPLRVSKEVSASLRELARQENATLYMVLLAAFQGLLHQLSGQRQIVIGADFARRDRRETEGLIGFFVNQLALCGDLGGNPSFLEMVDRARHTLLGAYGHQELPFHKLVDHLLPDRSLSSAPIFQVKLVLQNRLGSGVEIPGLELRGLEAEKGTAQLDLVLNIEDGPEGLTGSAEFAIDLFDRATIRSLLEDYVSLLTQVAEDPTTSLTDLIGQLEENQKQRQEREQEELHADLGRRFKSLRRSPNNASAATS